ncbi:MAG: hypothetical protein ACRD1X_01990 [Vicinamibacteria bacterium]
MKLTATAVDTSPDHAGWVRLIAEVEYKRASIKRERLWFAVPAELERDFSRTGNPWLACMAPIAAQLGEDVHIDLPVDAQLCRGVHQVFSIWKSWYPELTVPELHIGNLTGPTEISPNAGVACFFSGGVDSFFALLHHDSNLYDGESPVRDLLSVWGFDVPLKNVDAFQRMRRSLEGVARHFEKQLVPIATNLRVTEFARAHWGQLSHGAAMAAAALALEPRYSTVLIGSSFKAPWGSHFRTDPLFSTQQTKFIHYGSDFTRVQKTALVAQDPAAQTALRVCWRHGSDGNCAHCEKCYRTMVTLFLLGRLDAFTVFDTAGWDPTQIRNTYLGAYSSVQPFEEILALAESSGQAAIAECIQQALDRSRRIRFCRTLLNPLRRLPFVSGLARRIEWRLLRNLVT